MNIEEQTGKNIIELYGKSIFGKISKSEVDLLLFGSFIRKIFKDDHEIIDKKNYAINWFRIDSPQIRVLSQRLKITENRVSALLEQCALAEGLQELSSDALLNELKRIAIKTQQVKKDINEGKIALYIPNKIVYNAIVTFLLKTGSLTDTSFNKNLLIN